jgi:hypothetical protein
MKDRSKAKKRVALRSRDIHVGWIVGVGVSTVIFLLATFATAYRHDVYSSSLGLRDLVSTDVWFRVFLALTCFSLLLFLGLLVYAFIAGRIGGSGDSEEQELLPTTKTSEVKGEAPAVEEKAPATEQPERVIINEARLRDIFDSEFMHEWVREGKTYLDQVIEDLQFVRDNYVKGSKQDEEHFAAKHIIEIASILRKDRYFRRVYNSFTEWCCILFKCLSLEPPKRDNIKNPQEISNQVKKRFYYLLSKKE